MKLLIDECVLGETAINLAHKERAVIITNDLDFGNLILYPPGSHTGIIVLRPRLDTREAIDDVHNVLMRLLKELKPAEIKKSLIIVDKNKYRLRRE